jgi:hypothetical protein
LALEAAYEASLPWFSGFCYEKAAWNRGNLLDRDRADFPDCVFLLELLVNLILFRAFGVSI